MIERACKCFRCSGTAYAVEESALLVGRLDFDDAVNILSSPDTPLSILQHCFRHGVYLTLHVSFIGFELYAVKSPNVLRFMKAYRSETSARYLPSSESVFDLL